MYNHCMKRLEHETLTVTKSLSEIYLVMSQGRKDDDTDERMVMVILFTDLIYFLASRDTQDEMISKSPRVLTVLQLHHPHSATSGARGTRAACCCYSGSASYQ